MPTMIPEKVNVDVLHSAIIDALDGTGELYLSDVTGDDDVGLLICRVVEHVPEHKDHEDLEWWRPIAAVVSPIVTLTAAVIANPLGDNSEQARSALRRIREQIRLAVGEHCEEAEHNVRVADRAPKRRSKRAQPKKS